MTSWMTLMTNRWLPVCALLLLWMPTVTMAEQDLGGIMKAKLETILAAVNQPAGSAQSPLFETIDFPSITRGVLGKHRKTASDEQRQRFQLEFQKSMINLLRAATATAGDYRIDVTGSKVSEKNPERAQAYASVTTEDGQVIDMVASIAFLEGEWKVRNLIFGGVNLGKTYRSQFDQLVQQHAGDLDQAIAAWAARTVEAGVAAGS